MKRRQLLDHLHQHGCVVHNDKGPHTSYRNTATGKKTTVPRHSEIDDDLAKDICKQFGIEKIR